MYDTISALICKAIDHNEIDLKLDPNFINSTVNIYLFLYNIKENLEFVAEVAWNQKKHV